MIKEAVFNGNELSRATARQFVNSSPEFNVCVHRKKIYDFVSNSHPPGVIV
jgi:hypothetical protein